MEVGAGQLWVKMMLVSKKGHAHGIPQHGGTRLELHCLAEKADIALFHLKSWLDLGQGTSHTLSPLLRPFLLQ